MFFRSNDQDRVRKLSTAVREYMQLRFNMVPEYLDMLRCLEFDGMVNEKSVRCVHVFSPLRAREQHVCIRSRRELEQHPDMLLFEGYIDGRGSVYVADRRAPLVGVKTARLET